MGDFPSVQGVPAAWAGSGCRIWDLGCSPVPLPSAGVSVKSPGGGCFLGDLFFGGFLPPLPRCAGNSRAGVYPAAERRRRLCGGVPVAGGAGRDPEMASPSSSSPGLGKKPPLVSAQAPGKACRRVCPLARGCASKPSSAQGWCCSLPKSPRCFLPGDLCHSFPCASPSSPLPSHPAFPSASRMAPSSPCSFDLSKPVPVPSCPPHAGQCHRVCASSAGFGAFRGLRGITQRAGAASVLGGVTSHGRLPRSGKR